MKPQVASQMHRELLSIIGLNPYVDMDSSPRMQMFGSHLGQMLVTDGRTERYISTGMEQEFGKSTFRVEMPVDGRILKIIDRYHTTGDITSIHENPETLVIYETEDETREVCCFVLPRFCSYHSYFGFPYVKKPAVDQLREGQFVRAGTVFLDSPGITPDGNYCYGTELNVAFMSHPAVAEDGFVICEDQLDRFKFRTYEVRDVGWGKKEFPLNLYGDDKTYKAFPDIGDRVRDDGILVALRKHDTGLSPVKQNVKAMQRVDHNFDRRFYADGAGGVVIDVKVITNGDVQPQHTSTDHQLIKYIDQSTRYYQRILSFEKDLRRLRKERGQPCTLGRSFHSLVMEALVATNYTPGVSVTKTGKNSVQFINKQHRRAPLDEYRVEFTICYETTPRDGFKFTGAHGNKGVICHIAKPEHMPVDQDGNRADMLISPESNINRMLMGAPLELYVNAASRDVGKHVRRMVGIERGDPRTNVKLYQLMETDRNTVENAWAYLVSYYQVVAPKLYEWYSQPVEDEEKLAHLTKVVKDHVYLYAPPEDSPDPEMMALEIEARFKPTYGPVSYIGYSGQRVVTKNPVRIGSMTILMLEKIGNERSAVDSARVQHFGVPAPLTKSTKNTEPVRKQPVKNVGEMESRILASSAGPRACAEIMDRNNNPTIHKHIVHQLLRAPKPTNVAKLVDRTLFPYGGAKPIQHVNHILTCGGIKFAYHSNKTGKKL